MEIVENKVPVELFTYKILQDGVLRHTIKDSPNDFPVLGWMLCNQGQSCHWAKTYGGWKIEVYNSKGNFIGFW